MRRRPGEAWLRLPITLPRRRPFSFVEEQWIDGSNRGPRRMLLNKREKRKK
jgi:hypothetical protein